MIKIMLSILLYCFCCHSFAKDFCSNMSKTAENEQAYVDHSKNLFRVVSKTRLYFNSAPSKRCKISDLFIVNGWLKLSDLKNTGYTSGPSSDEQTAFNIIPDAIKKNALATAPEKCINISRDDTDNKYYKFAIN
ncbi:hypothetical protein AB6R35_002296 [Klebsiella variicola]